MKIFKTGVFISMLLLTTPILEAQNTTIPLLEESLEQLTMQNEEVSNWEDELEELSQRLQEPINLNRTTRQQLEQFPFLNDLQIEKLLDYVSKHGEMQTLYELQLVEEMDKQTIDLLRPFVCVQPTQSTSTTPSFKNILRYGKHEVTTRLDIPLYTRKGYETSYLGPAPYHSLRYKFHYGDHLQAGITAEKDAGEPLFALHNRKGYDYYSPYLLLKNRGKLRTLALGNYRLSFGQGLVVNTDFRLGKSFSLSTANYRAGGIRKHSSTDEYNYFQGIAATVGFSPCIELSAFYSHRSLDGSVKDGTVTSITKNGLHRTQKEADKRHALTLQMAGGHLSFQKNRLQVGATGLYYFFNLPYEPTLQKYAKYNLHGNRFYNLGLDYRYRLGRLSLVGEAATATSGYALLNRLHYHLSYQYKLTLIHRYYSHDYWSLFGRSFGESTTPQNENGWYLAAEAAPLARWKFFASLDMFSFPWWKYRISKPSQGVDAMFQTTYTPRHNLSMYLNYRYKHKERDVTGTGGATTLPILHHRLRYRLTFVSGSWNIRTTLDYNHFRQQDGQGYHFTRKQGYQCTQSFSYTFPAFPLSLTLQGNYFHTDDYDSRVYASERGLLYTFYTPSFYGTGFRYSTLLRYDLKKLLTLLVKYGQTVYQDRESIGSGNDLIEGNKKTDLQMQLRIRF